MSYHPEKDPVHEPETTDPGPHSFSINDPDYELIKAQLLDATERYSATQSKAVMAELERRLLARQQTASFITFLVSVILLNCVERMSLLYRSFDTNTPTQQDDNTDALDLTEQPSGIPTDWPLDSAPSVFWSQGQSFANLLQLLLRLRGLPPRTYIKVDGSLVVISNDKINPVEIPADGPYPDSVDEQEVLMAQWLGDTNVSVPQLQMAKDGGDDTALVPGAWDLRFIAGLLLPE